MNYLNTLAGIILTLVMPLALAACGDGGASATDCWNPKLMRVKVGETVLDLPYGVDLSSWDGHELDGVLKLRLADWKGNRQTCQRKDRVPLDYGPRAHLTLRDRPAQRDYIIGALFDARDPDNRDLLDFRRLTRSITVTDTDWQTMAGNAEYLSDDREAGASVFAGSRPAIQSPPWRYVSTLLRTAHASTSLGVRSGRITRPCANRARLSPTTASRVGAS